MNETIVFMFSGQGSQYYQMGRELYEEHPRFKLWMNHCNQIVSPLIEVSLIDVLYGKHNKSEPFDRILYTNPALISIEYSLAKILIEAGIKPDIFLGYSLGEITAAILSQGMSLEQGLQLSIEFAKLLERESPAAGMLAIMESEGIISKFPELFENCWLSGQNFHNNFVVSGLSEEIHILQKTLHRKNIISQRLAVNYGFHSKIMDPLEAHFKFFAQNIHFFKLRTPVVSCLTSESLLELDERYLWNLVRDRVNFKKTIENLVKHGDYIFIDVGPSGTLSTLVKYLLPAHSRSIYMETMNQYGRNLDSLKKLNNHFEHKPSFV